MMNNISFKISSNDHIVKMDDDLKMARTSKTTMWTLRFLMLMCFAVTAGWWMQVPALQLLHSGSS